MLSTMAACAFVSIQARSFARFPGGLPLTLEKIMSLYDVIEVGMEKPHAVRIIERGKTLKNADAIVKMAVARRGVGAHFFTSVKPGSYKDGEPYRFDD